MARILIIGCGCRGRALASSLIERGHAVRGTTRREDQLPAIEGTGAEAVLGDPDRVATLAPALADVGVVVFLLGSAHGTKTQLEALHGPRLQMLLTRVLDSPARAFVYESGETPVLDRGAELVTTFCERSHIPFRVMSAADPGPWADTVEALLA